MTTEKAPDPRVTRWLETRSHEAKNELLLAYMPLVRRVASDLSPAVEGHMVISYEDRVTMGTFGLIEAVQRCDSEKAPAFGSYARKRIRGAIIDDIRKARPAGRQAIRMNKVAEQIEAEEGRTPGIAEVADHLGISLQTAQRNARKQLPLDTEGGVIAPAAEDTEGAAVGSVFTESLSDLVSALVKGLKSDAERTVIIAYYIKQMSIREIAGMLNVSYVRVHQLHHNALKHLRLTLEARDRDRQEQPLIVTPSKWMPLGSAQGRY